MSVSLIKDTDLITEIPTENPSSSSVTMYSNPEIGDKRETMPKGGYRFGASNAALRPVVPKGQ